MAWPLRLSLLRLRAKINFRLFRLVLVLVYVTITAMAIIYHFNGSPEQMDELLVDQWSQEKPKGKFVLTGLSNRDFRRDRTGDQRIPENVREFEALVEDGLGEKGKGVNLRGKEKKEGEEIEKKWAFNKVASDKVSLWRSLPDIRTEACQKLQYDSSLPTASVVIIFNNEALSALLRTAWSVIDRTPKQLLHEVILVDDFSNHSEITSLLPDYVTHRFPATVRLVRTPNQLGLIGARQEGAKAATGDVVVFLDSHCEATHGWAEPMLQRIKDDPTVVAIPQIDMIDATTLQFYGRGSSTVSVGGFTWSGHFTWESLPDKVARNRKPTDPAQTATMAGGLLAINRKFFWRLGGYDAGMTGWGGENLEMSFRVWRCGGSMENHPCSHVGHIFRPFHPYFIPHDSHGINTARMAEVWMDEYKRFFYMHRQDLTKADIGNLTERFAIKEKLQCESFKWYLDNIYPHKYIMDEMSIAWGRLRSKGGRGDICIDHLQRDMAHKLTSYILGEYICHPFLGSSQYYTVSKKGEFRNEYMCGELEKAKDGDDKRKIRMAACHGKGGNQEWTLLPTGHLKHVASSMCMDRGGGGAGEEVHVMECKEGEDKEDKENQIWTFDYYAQGNQHLRPKDP